MSVAALCLFTNNIAPAVVLAPMFGALSGYLARKYKISQEEEMGAKYGAIFQATAVFIIFPATLVQSIFLDDDALDQNHTILRLLNLGISYALSYYIFNKKWPLSHKAALINSLSTSLLTGLSLLIYQGALKSRSI